MYKLVHQIFGAYTLSIPKNDGIRLINLLTQNKLLYWGIKKTEDAYFIKASLFSCEACIRTAAEEGISLSITKMSGLPFVFAKYKGRLGLILGSLAGLFLIFYSQLFIWEVDVIGNDKVSEAVIINALESLGVKRGAFIPDLSVEQTEQLFLLQNNEISSIAINIKGTYAEICLLERTLPPEFNNDSGYYNVVASDDGIIIKVKAVDGSPEVKAGDVVVKGQLLISSFMKGRTETYQLTHAQGEILAQVNEKYSVSIPLEQTEKIYTGKTETITSTVILGHPFDFLSSDKTSFEFYDVNVTQHEQTILGIIKTPVTVTTAKFTEYKINQYTLTEEAAKKRAEEAFAQYLDRIEWEVKSHESNGYYDKEKNAYVLTASVVVIKNIAVEKEFKITG